MAASEEQVLGTSAQGTITPIIEMRELTKRYASVTALDSVDFHISPGEVVGLLGDNGAGKSTLIKILSGIVQPTTGTILYNGEPTKIRSRGDLMRWASKPSGYRPRDQMIMRNIFSGARK